MELAPYFLKGRKLTVKSIFHVYEDICNWYSMNPPPLPPDYDFHGFGKLPFYLACQDILNDFAPTVFSNVLVMQNVEINSTLNDPILILSEHI